MEATAEATKAAKAVVEMVVLMAVVMVVLTVVVVMVVAVTVEEVQKEEASSVAYGNRRSRDEVAAHTPLATSRSESSRVDRQAFRQARRAQRGRWLRVDGLVARNHGVHASRLNGCVVLSRAAVAAAPRTRLAPRCRLRGQLPSRKV